MEEKIIEIEENYTQVVEYKKLVIPLVHVEGSRDSVELSKALFECEDIKVFETDFAKHVIGSKWNEVSDQATFFLIC